MKKALLYLILLMTFNVANATNYYISSSSGNDTNDGKTPQTAWKSIAKLNTVKENLLPGDSILFKCNDTFFDQIIVSKSGNSSKCIYYGSYGSGNKPIISGKTTVSNWTHTSENIWSAECLDCTGKVTNFFINDIPQQIGRWPNVTDPNKGYRTFNSIGTNQITDKTLSDTIDWTGAEVVVRNVHWELNRLIIKSQNKGTLQFTPPISSSYTDASGYFIQNDTRTLDIQGEWYFNGAKKQFTIFSETDPNTFVTKATNCDTLINLNGLKYITIENLHFDGAGLIAINANNCNYIIIRNNDITFSGVNGVETNISNFITFENNLINKTNNNALEMIYSNHLTVRNNIIKNTALVAGMGLSGWNYFAARIVNGKDYLIEYNNIDSSGYLGLEFEGDSILIQNNIFSNYCLTKDDGGAIYTSRGAGSPINYSRKLIGNIVYNGIGAPEGTGGRGTAANGIYMDDGTPNVDVLYNTVFNCADQGIVIHNANHINVKGNNVYNNDVQLYFHSNHPTFQIKSCVIDSNTFVSKLATQDVMRFITIYDDIPYYGSFDYNYYCRPLDDSLVIYYNYFKVHYIIGKLTLESWKKLYTQDLHSGKSPITIKTNPDDYIRFEYNATKKDTTIVLKDSYVDVKGMTVSGNIILKPYTSIILFKKICSGIVPSRPDTIIGDLNVCPGSPIKYSIAPVPGATYYTWKLPNGWTGTSTSYDITAIAGATGGTISVVAKNVCDSSSARTINVTVNSGITPAQPEAISGNTNICLGTSNTYSIATVSGATDYTWKLPDGWTGTSTTNSINVKAATTSGNITVTANNGCGPSAPQTLSVTTNTIIPETPVITLSNGILQSNATSGNQWYLNPKIIKDATNPTYIPSQKGYFYVVVTVNGCVSEPSNLISFNPTTGINQLADNERINVYPNPTTGEVKITLNNNFNTDYIVDIYDNIGILLQTLKKSKSETSFDLDLSIYSEGTYLISIYNSNRYYQTKVVKR